MCFVFQQNYDNGSQYVFYTEDGKQAQCLEDIEGRTVHVTDTFSKPRMSYAQLVIIFLGRGCMFFFTHLPSPRFQRLSSMCGELTLSSLAFKRVTSRSAIKTKFPSPLLPQLHDSATGRKQLVIFAATVLCVTVGARKPNVLGFWMVACVQFMVWTIQKHNFVSLDCFICALVP